jgi:hypothetical protein
VDAGGDQGTLDRGWQLSPPDGTCSYADLLLADADPSVRALVGTPNVFFSHAWSAVFANVVMAMRVFVDERPATADPVFFWSDIGCVDGGRPLSGAF